MKSTIEISHPGHLELEVPSRNRIRLWYSGFKDSFRTSVLLAMAAVGTWMLTVAYLWVVSNTNIELLVSTLVYLGLLVELWIVQLNRI